MATQLAGTASSWFMVRNEISTVLSAMSSTQMSRAAAMFSEHERRWFCSGQGRSGLVAQMCAMRLMHAGFETHAVGEPTAPSIGQNDGLIMISGSGETPVSVHLTKLARESGARILAVTAHADSTLAGLSHTVIEVPTTETSQFGGTQFEQSALLLLDALILDLTAAAPEAYTEMKARHTNLQ